MSVYLLIEESRLYAVAGYILGIEVTEELEEESPLLWHWLAWFHLQHILLEISYASAHQNNDKVSDYAVGMVVCVCVDTCVNTHV